MEQWFSQVTKAMENNIPKVKYKTIPFPQITIEIKNIQLELENLVNEIQFQGHTLPRRRKMNQLKGQLEEKWRILIEEQWENKIMETQRINKEPNQFWRNIKKLLGNNLNKSRYLKRDDGTRCFDPDQELEFRQKWKPIYQIPIDENRQFCRDKEIEVQEYLRNNEELWHNSNITDYSLLSNYDQLIRPITIDEICTSLQKKGQEESTRTFED